MIFLIFLILLLVPITAPKSLNFINIPKIRDGKEFSTQTPEYNKDIILCDSLHYWEFGIPQEKYNEIFEDEKVSDAERVYLHTNYYEPSPKVFKASATLYGYDFAALNEILQYGLWIRQQMWRGWVLIGSGEYGYHPELREELVEFVKKDYGYKDPSDILLSKQKSPLYFYFADGGVDRLNRTVDNELIAVKYDELNDKQKRVYDLTDRSAEKSQKEFYTSIAMQSNQSPKEALDSGKYIGVVSAKSINDFGRRFLMYRCNNRYLDFVGVVIVGGEAKRDDWTGLGSPTNANFKFDHFPLSIREFEGEHWGFDLPLSLYIYYGGEKIANIDPFEGGHVGGIITVDPDAINDEERILLFGE